MKKKLLLLLAVFALSNMLIKKAQAQLASPINVLLLC
jgi:hypothetical protein